MAIQQNPFAKSAAEAKSPIFVAVHESPSDLHALGFIEQRKIRILDLLRGASVSDVDSKKKRVLRAQFRSQTVLAPVLITRLSTVCQ